MCTRSTKTRSPASCSATAIARWPRVSFLTPHVRPQSAPFGTHSARPALVRLAPPLADVTLEIAALTWSNLSSWTGASDGPPSREHPSMWIDEADPTRLLVFGGYAFEPRQYTLVWDLWQFDLGTRTWSSIAMNN